MNLYRQYDLERAFEASDVEANGNWSSHPCQVAPRTSPGVICGADRRLRRHRHGFTLVEMLVVLGVVALMLGLVLPALGPLKDSQDVTTAAYNLASALETARNYAMANDTYTWVGFYEQDATSTSAPATAATPAYPGVGHLTMAIVYSKDGTKVVPDTSTDSQPLQTKDAPYPLGQVGKLIQIYSVHLNALKAPDTPNSTAKDTANTMQGRPYQTDLDTTSLEQTLISSESPDITLRPFTVQGYTFYKTVRFNPRGEANINSTLPCTRIIEFGLQPTHGAVKDSVTKNLVVVQQAGIGGAVNIYRP